MDWEIRVLRIDRKKAMADDGQALFLQLQKGGRTVWRLGFYKGF